MSKKLADLRFAVRSATGQVSSVWRVWVVASGEVHLSTSSPAETEKYTFEISGVCRSAFTPTGGGLEAMPERATYSWRREPTPPAGGGNAARAAWIAFPTDFLSAPAGPAPEGVTWIDAAPAGGATFVEVAFTRDREQATLAALGSGTGRKLVQYVWLPTREGLVVDYYHGKWENADVRVRHAGTARETMCSAKDPDDTGRPVRIRVGPPPNDGDALVLQELGGYGVAERGG